MLLKNIKYLINFFSYTHLSADNHNFYEIIEQLQKDIKTLEKAVYSGSVQLSSDSANDLNFNSNNKKFFNKVTFKNFVNDILAAYFG